MDALKKKWNSRRGASILLALLFLLVCMRVGASILMAAASNSGKIDSNKKEQQRYLTLSSALTLLCDELESVEYVGMYDYYPDGCGHDEAHILDHIYTRKDGVLRYRADGKLLSDDWGQLKEVLPLVDNMDAIFAEPENFVVPEGNKATEIGYVYELNSIDDPPPFSYTLELQANAGDSYGGLSEKVQVTAKLRKTDGSIVLTARLLEQDKDGKWQDSGYTMTAWLWPESVNWLDLLALEHEPANSTNETKPVRWKLEYITKEGETDTP